MWVFNLIGFGLKKEMAVNSHITSDVVRGVTKTLYPENQTGEQQMTNMV